MGTSTSQRSPRTPEWERVQRLYQDPQAPAEAIVARIVQALGPETRAGMADGAVARCLATLTQAGAGLLPGLEPAVDPALPGAAALAAALRTSAEADIARARVASRFGELALDALTAAALDLAPPGRPPPDVVRATLARYAEERRLADLARTFLAHDMGYAFRYFAERDLPAHVGGPRLSTAEEAARLADQIAGVCTEGVSALKLSRLEGDLGRAVVERLALGDPLYQAVLAAGIGDSLQALGGIT